MPLGRGARAKTETLARRERVAYLYLQGWTQHRIGQEYGVVQQVISDDLHAVRAMWRESLIRNFDDARAQELAKIDRVELEYWEAWERSQHPAETTDTERDSAGKSKASVRRVGQSGNPRFLEGVERCIEKRCKLLGLNAPEKQEVDILDTRVVRLPVKAQTEAEWMASHAEPLLKDQTVEAQE